MTSMRRVNMAFGQNGFVFPAPWGDAPGYGEEWPSAKSAVSENVQLQK